MSHISARAMKYPEEPFAPFLRRLSEGGLRPVVRSLCRPASSSAEPDRRWLDLGVVGNTRVSGQHHPGSWLARRR